mgnify:FL=1
MADRSAARRQAEEALARVDALRDLSSPVSLADIRPVTVAAVAALRGLLEHARGLESALGGERTRREEAEAKALHTTVYAEAAALRLNHIRKACAEYATTNEASDLAAVIVEILDGATLAAAASPAPQPTETLTRAEAIAAGIPIHPDAVGVRIWGASATAPAPPAGDVVREAAERFKDAVIAAGGCSCTGVDECPHDRAERAAVYTLANAALAALDAAVEPAGDEVRGEMPSDLWAMVAANDATAVMDRLKAHFGLPPYDAAKGGAR